MSENNLEGGMKMTQNTVTFVLLLLKFYTGNVNLSF